MAIWHFKGIFLGLFFYFLTLFLVANIFSNFGYLDFIQIYYQLCNKILKGHEKFYLIIS